MHKSMSAVPLVSSLVGAPAALPGTGPVRRGPPARSRSVALLLACSAVAWGLAGCESMSEREQGTAKGAAIGAVGGAIIGSATGGKAGKGAVVGGVVGAVAGNLWTKRMQDKQRAMEQATRGTGVDVVRTADNQLKLNIPADYSFDVGRAAVKPDMAGLLNQFAHGLDAGMRVQVVGHTDNTGSQALNNALSLERAESVREHLQRQGLPASRIGVAGRGENQPVADNASAEGRARNRRVEIFLSEPESAAQGK
jgi:outer membrane protein OmpA-like peptidoglycan-associated protein